MDRRRFLLTSLAGALAAALAAGAEETKVYRVGALLQGSPPLPGSTPGLLRLGLRDLGYVEGRNLVVDFRYAEGKNDRFPGLAAEIVALNPDVLVADSTPAALAAKRATATIRL
jgi:putative ABC transport system substrate-binding protein